MRVRVIFAWYDLWVGAFWDKRRLTLYVLPLPMIGIAIDFKPRNIKAAMDRADYVGNKNGKAIYYDEFWSDPQEEG